MTARVVSAADVDLRLLLVEDDGTYASYIGATLMSVFSAHFQYDHVISIGAAVERLSDGHTISCYSISAFPMPPVSTGCRPSSAWLLTFR